MVDLHKMKWAAIALCIGVCASVSWVAAPFVAFKYASSKMEWIITSDVTRSEVEENKGFLSSKEFDRAMSDNHEFVFEEFLANENNKIVTYSLFGIFFTVIYDEDDHPLAIINNGMHGSSPI